MTATGIGAALYLMLIVLAAVLVVCWIILPFAVIGTKPLLQQLLAEQKRTNEILVRLEAAQQWQRVNEPRSLL